MLIVIVILELLVVGSDSFDIMGVLLVVVESVDELFTDVRVLSLGSVEKTCEGAILDLSIFDGSNG
jgi:hypothetical protein